MLRRTAAALAGPALALALTATIAAPGLAAPPFRGAPGATDAPVAALRQTPATAAALPGASTSPGAGAAVPAVAASGAGPAGSGSTASAAPVAGGDTRSSGTPPSFVGQPVLAAIGVIVLGLLTAAAAAAYVRLSQR